MFGCHSPPPLGVIHLDRINASTMQRRRNDHKLVVVHATSAVKGPHVKIPVNISVSDLTSDDMKVQADAAKIRRALVNLIENAVDSMPNGGKLTISSHKSNNYVEIKVIESGSRPS